MDRSQLHKETLVGVTIHVNISDGKICTQIYCIYIDIDDCCFGDIKGGRVMGNSLKQF